MWPVTARKRSSWREVRSPVRAMWRSSHGGSKARPANRSLSEPRPGADRPGVDAGHRDEGAEAERQRVRHRVVPARMRRDQPRLRDHVAVEEDEDVVHRRPRARVARPCEPETTPLLAHHPQVEAGRGGGSKRRLGAVVDHHHLEEPARIALSLESGEGERERLGRLEAGHDDAHPVRGPECLRLRERHLAPVVVAHRGRSRRRHGLARRRHRAPARSRRRTNPRAGRDRSRARVPRRHPLARASRSRRRRARGAPGPAARRPKVTPNPPGASRFLTLDGPPAGARAGAGAVSPARDARSGPPRRPRPRRG